MHLGEIIVPQSAQCRNMRWWWSYIVASSIFIPLANCIGNLTDTIGIMGFKKKIESPPMTDKEVFPFVLV